MNLLPFSSSSSSRSSASKTTTTFSSVVKPLPASHFGLVHAHPLDHFHTVGSYAKDAQMNLPDRAMVEILGLHKVSGPQSPKDNFIIKITEPISNNSATAVCNSLQLIEGWYRNPDGSLNKELIANKPVMLSIRSGGGSIIDGLRIINQMQHLQKDLGVKVITYADGFVGSMASVIFAAGTERYMAPHSYLHLHEGSAGMTGKVSDIAGQFDHLKMIQKELNQLLSDFSRGKKKPEDFAKEAKHDLVLRPKPVIEDWGLADHIGQPLMLYHINGIKLEQEEAQAKAKAEAEAEAEQVKAKAEQAKTKEAAKASDKK